MGSETTGHDVLVVYESMFGNTEAVARSIADGIAAAGVPATVVDVEHAPLQLDDVELVIVGAPTHAFGMSRPATRTSARGQGATGPVERGVREWLDQLRRPARKVPGACFDTRIRTPFPLPSAAQPIRRRLRHLGLDVTADPMRFDVTGTPGPLADGERERARAWGAALVARLGEVDADGPAVVPVNIAVDGIDRGAAIRATTTARTS
jgi:hypothetical protein